MPYLWGKAEADSLVCNDVRTFPSSYRTSSLASVMLRIIDDKCFILEFFFRKIKCFELIYLLDFNWDMTRLVIN
jgi:hypothetical protein